MSQLSLGLDVSTQSVSAVVLDIESCSVIAEYSLDYRADERLNSFGIGKDYIIPAAIDGEANQPAAMFFAAVDAVLADISKNIDIQKIAVINVSGQQHGHVYLNSMAKDTFNRLLHEDSADSDLVSLLTPGLAWDAAPIWMTSSTGNQSAFIRDYVGGTNKLIGLSGSDAPLRFTGSVIRYVGQMYPGVYKSTRRIQLVSSLIPGVLSGNADVPFDFGNASGMTLMDYRKKVWSDELIEAVSDGLEGGAGALGQKLPDIVSPETVVGAIAPYFIRKYGFSPSCKIIAGSGDNPQSKVLVTGDLLSLGTSIVNMVSTDGAALDMNGYASAMYDGIGRPFMFGTRTNGVMLWDRMRSMYGLGKNDYAPAEEALKQSVPGENLLFWQIRKESFPPSGIIDITRVGGFTPAFTTDYPALIDTVLASVYVYSKKFTRETRETIYVTGGARNSREILRRVAAIWNRPVTPIQAGGAALGAAVAGVYGMYLSEQRPFDIDGYSSRLLKKEREIVPSGDDAARYHQKGGFLDRLITEEANVLKKG